ncbi:unnamed protein product [Phytophthora fragariaefolia]|uniref:Unnamed protein product n=1 Tax=Phytophthora fragariaefolia TaxID=1490495 RepID=A0A9W6Y029_9STRA|nr:unnamed protein product [Phytophthora fragariaefolia]
MGGFFSRNLVVPQHSLSVVATSTVPQNSKVKRNKHHKFNTLVPEPPNANQSSHTNLHTSRDSFSCERQTHADLRVQFLKAVKRGDVNEMADLLRRYPLTKPTSPDSHEDENEEGIEELVNVRGMWESTPLISATQYAHCEAALWLLSNGANPHASNEKSVTALLLASVEGLTPVVVELLKTATSTAGAPPIDKQIGIVYNSAADVNVRLSPLLAASMNGHLEIVRHLLDHGADVNQFVLVTVGGGASTDISRGSTALLLASRYGHAEVVALLLQRKADCTLVDEATNSSPLLSACEYSHEECALLLFESMTAHSKPRLLSHTETEKWQAPNYQGLTALHFAATNGLLQVCKALLSALKEQQNSLEDEVMAMVFVNARAGARRETALLLAVRKRQHEVARLLLEAGADAELADRGGNTAIQILSRSKQDALLQLCEASISKSQRQLSAESPVVENTVGSPDSRLHKAEELRSAESHATDADAEISANVVDR